MLAFCIRPNILFFLTNFLLIACEDSHNIKYSYLGQASFRRTYAGHEHWSDSQLDSVERSNPSYMITSHDSSENVLDALYMLGIANKNELFLDKITLKDTIVVGDKKSYMDTVCIRYDFNKKKAAIQIKNGLTMDSIPINSETIWHTLSLIALKDSSQAFIFLINKYYIMNGDNYEVSLYEKN